MIEYLVPNEIKGTPFSEAPTNMQLMDKINEIIDAINHGTYEKDMMYRHDGNNK